MSIRFVIIAWLLAPGLAAPASAEPAVWRAAGWKTDFSITEVDFDEIISGGPARDGIPSIDSPVFEQADLIKNIGPNEPVIRLELDGVVRAYPLRVLTWHEIVNDTLAGKPVLVTYCPLCNSSIAFERNLADGTVPTFGVSGLLRNSDMVMYDRDTESWWQQFTGRGIVGERAGQKLNMIPSRIQAFGAFARENPTADVLVPRDPSIRAYGQNPYVAYDSRQAPYPFYTGALPAELPPMMRVVVVRDDEQLSAVTLPYLKSVGSVEVDGIRLSWSDGVSSALDDANIAEGTDIGSVVGERIDDGSPVVHDTTFAFVVLAFHPGLTVMTEGGAVMLTGR